MQCELCAYVFEPNFRHSEEGKKNECPICGTINEGKPKNSARAVDERYFKSNLSNKDTLKIPAPIDSRAQSPIFPARNKDVELRDTGDTARLVDLDVGRGRQHVMDIVADRYGLSSQGGQRVVLSRDSLQRLADPLAGKDPLQALSPRARRRRLENMMKLNAQLDARQDTLSRKAKDVSSTSYQHSSKRRQARKEKGDQHPLKKAEQFVDQEDFQPQDLNEQFSPTQPKIVLPEAEEGVFITAVGLAEEPSPNLNSSISPIENSPRFQKNVVHARLEKTQEKPKIIELPVTEKAQARLRMGLNPFGAAQMPKNDRLSLKERAALVAAKRAAALPNKEKRGHSDGGRRRYNEAAQGRTSPRSAKSDLTGVRPRPQLNNRERHLQNVRGSGNDQHSSPGRRRPRQTSGLHGHRNRGISPVRMHQNDPLKPRNNGWMQDAAKVSEVEDKILKRAGIKKTLPIPTKVVVKESGKASRNRKQFEVKKERNIKQTRLKPATEGMQAGSTFLTGLDMEPEDEENQPVELPFLRVATNRVTKQVHSGVYKERGQREIEERFVHGQGKPEPNKKQKPRVAWDVELAEPPERNATKGMSNKKKVQKGNSLMPYQNQVQVEGNPSFGNMFPVKSKRSSFRLSIRNTIQSEMEKNDTLKKDYNGDLPSKYFNQHSAFPFKKNTQSLLPLSRSRLPKKENAKNTKEPHESKTKPNLSPVSALALEQIDKDFSAFKSFQLQQGALDIHLDNYEQDQLDPKYDDFVQRILQKQQLQSNWGPKKSSRLSC